MAGEQLVKDNELTFGVRGLSQRRFDPWKNRSTLQTTEDPPMGKSHQNRKKMELEGRNQAIVVRAPNEQ